VFVRLILADQVSVMSFVLYKGFVFHEVMFCFVSWSATCIILAELK